MLRELEHTDLTETTSDKTEFTLTDDHQSALAQIQESVRNLYDISWLQGTGVVVVKKDL